MEPQEARKIVVSDIREVYAHAWTQFAFIKDEHARVRAINGVMITIDKVWPFLPPKDPAPVPAVAGPAKPPAEVPVTPPANKPTTPASPPAAPTASQTTKPTAPQMPVKDDKPAPETVEGEPAYDRKRLHWNYCDEIVERDGKKEACGNRDIDAETEKVNRRTGKTFVKKWQACFECRVFLNADGKKVPMDSSDPPQETKA